LGHERSSPCPPFGSKNFLHGRSIAEAIEAAVLTQQENDIIGSPIAPLFPRSDKFRRFLARTPGSHYEKQEVVGLMTAKLRGGREPIDPEPDSGIR